MIWLALLLAQNLTDGARIFAQSCSVGYCHGVAGAAGRGPRLRGRTFDRNYLYRVIRDGIPKSAMPAWKDRLREDEIQAVVDYVTKLGTESAEPAAPANPMPPGTGPAALPAFNGPTQAERGRQLFFDAARETNCGVCHSLGGRGIAIGPDVAALAGKTPREMAAAIRSARSRHVLTARLTNGEVFPALRFEQNENSVRLYDLTVPPPVLRTFERSEIESLTENPGWCHDAFAKDYGPAQLADIIGYIRWAALGEKTEVRPADVND